MDFEQFKLKYQKKEVTENRNQVNKKPEVSVLIQTYQHGDYIQKCLDGVLMQKTDFKFEILLGEDESKDGTREICIEYAKEHPETIRLFLHHRENNMKIEGTVTGRFILMFNLFSARGKSIALCDGDDYWTDTYKLQKQVDFLKSKPSYSACFTNATIVNEMDDEKERNFIKLSKNRSYSIQEVIRAGGGFFPTSSLAFRNLIRNFPDFVIHAKSGDRWLSLLLAEKGKFYLLNENTCVYRIHQGGMFSSIAHNFSERLGIDYNNLQLLRDFDHYSKDKYHHCIKRTLSNYSQRILRKYPKEVIGEEKKNLQANLNCIDWLKFIKNNF